VTKSNLIYQWIGFKVIGADIVRPAKFTHLNVNLLYALNVSTFDQSWFNLLLNRSERLIWFEFWNLLWN